MNEGRFYSSPLIKGNRPLNKEAGARVSAVTPPSRKLRLKILAVRPMEQNSERVDPGYDQSWEVDDLIHEYSNSGILALSLEARTINRSVQPAM